MRDGRVERARAGACGARIGGLGSGRGVGGERCLFVEVWSGFGRLGIGRADAKDVLFLGLVGLVGRGLGC